MSPAARVACSNCGNLVYAQPQVQGAKIISIIPVDDRGWCGTCRWLEDEDLSEIEAMFWGEEMFDGEE